MSRKKTLKTSSPAKSDHVAKADKYIDDVLSGRVAACKEVRAACQRQRDDLVRLKSHPLYVWVPDKGARACRFLERLPHIKGPKANAKELAVLEPWQRFIITTVFGWRRKDTGGRRFKRSYTEVPRGNGKSFISAGIGLYCMSNDDEEGAEVYSAATTRDQAKIVWGDAQTMMRKRPEFAAKIGIGVAQHSIYHSKTNSKFIPLSREADNQDGLNVHCAVIDELHAHKTRETYDVVETASAKRTNSLIWVITTAGSDTSGICYEIRGYVKKILDGLEDDTQFGIIYTIDEGDDWTSPDIWKKANPNWGVSVIPETFAALAFKAMQTPSAQANFKTKHLDVWVDAAQPAFDMRAWDKGADLSLKIDDFAGMEYFEGVDLASKIDIASRARVFVKREKTPDAAPGEPMASLRKGQTDLHYYLFVTNYLPEAAVTDGRNSQYGGWVEEGWITTTPGDVLDYGVVKEDIVRDAHSFKLKECGFDPWQMQQMATELVAEGLPMVEVRPSVQNFSAAMKELDAAMRSGRLHHDGSPAMRWMVSNTVAHLDAKDNIYPRKEKAEKKIDGVVATITAFSRAMLFIPPESKMPRIRVL